jgi:hypothetical protein
MPVGDENVQCFPEKYHARCTSVRAWHYSIARGRSFDIGDQPAVWTAQRAVQGRSRTYDRYVVRFVVRFVVSAHFGRAQQRSIQDCHTRARLVRTGMEEGLRKDRGSQVLTSNTIESCFAGRAHLCACKIGKRAGAREAPWQGKSNREPVRGVEPLTYGLQI